MVHTELRGPVGALEWTRRLRVGEAWTVNGGFLAAGPKVLPAIPKESRSVERQVRRDDGEGFSIGRQISLMWHRPC